MNTTFHLKPGRIILTRIMPPGIYDLSVVFPDNVEVSFDQVPVSTFDHLYLSEHEGGVIYPGGGYNLLYRKTQP